MTDHSSEPSGENAASWPTGRRGSPSRMALLRSRRRVRRKADTPQQGPEARIRAQGVEGRMHLEPDHEVRALGVGPVEPLKRGIVLAERGVEDHESDRWDITARRGGS